MTVTVDLSKIRRNLRFLRSKTAARICSVVKADAYGHGLIPVARAVENESDELAVATAGEAARLTRAGIVKPIDILGCVDRQCASEYAPNVCPTVASLEEIDFLSARGYSGKINLKVNTGMNRIGCVPGEVGALLKSAEKNGMTVKSAFTHFYDAENRASAERQFELFSAVIRRYGGEIGQFHCCASNFLFLPREMHVSMVRVGLALYGYGHPVLQPAMTVTAPVLQVFPVKAGEHVGYGQTIVPCVSTVAALRAGYGDGYRRRTEQAPRYVCADGALCPVLGQICMDVTMIDVSGLDVKAGDTVYLLGGSASCENLAVSYGTISYEVLASFLPRTEREYLGQNSIAQSAVFDSIGRYLQSR